jgi:hypothetical protein
MKPRALPLVFLGLAVVAACERNNVPEAQTSPAKALTPPPATEAPTASAVSVTLFRASEEYVKTGNDALPKVLPERRELTVSGPNAPSAEIAQAALHALATPTNAPSLLPAWPERVKLRSVRVAQGTAEVDLARDGLSGGSLEETLLVEATVRTLTGIAGIERVQFLVEGKPVETLMGHADVSKPLP